MSSTLDLEQNIAALVDIAVRSGVENEPRTQQSRAGLIGPSDIGFCRYMAALTVKEVQPTDSTDPWAATIGVAIHNHIERFLEQAYGDTWLIEKQKVTATLPRTGAQITGTPDLIIPEYNLVLDAKTVDGLRKVQHYGPSQSHQYQRHLLKIQNAPFLKCLMPHLVSYYYIILNWYKILEIQLQTHHTQNSF